VALLVRPVPGEGDAAEPGREQAQERAGAARAARGQLLLRDGELQQAEAGAAVLLGNRETEPAAGTELGSQLLGPAVLRVAAGPVVQAELGTELAHPVPNGDGLLGEGEVHGVIFTPLLRRPAGSAR
jgi:hypothetical protein